MMRIKISNFALMWFGVGISLFLILSAIVQIPVEGGNNYYTTDTVLGILINHDIFALSTYIFLVALIIASSLDFLTKK